jgi:hypothetical protein
LKASALDVVEAVRSLMADNADFTPLGRKPLGKDAFRTSEERRKDVRLECWGDISGSVCSGNWAYLE